MSGGLRAAALGGGRFSPLSLSPFLWLDPSDFSTLFQDAAGTTPVTADSDPVGLIRDKSGNGNHLSQSTAGSRPLYKAPSGHSRIEGDGVDDYLINVAFSLAQPYTMVIGLNITSGNVAIGDGGLGTSTYIQNAAPLLFHAGGGVIQFSPSNTVDVDFIATIIANGASSKVALDNNAYVTGDPGSNDFVGFTFFGEGANNLSNARCSDIVILDRVATDPEIASLRTYLAAKQGRAL
jgi:hypothetical protein